MRFLAAVAVALICSTSTYAAGLLNKDQARIAAAKFIKGYCFGPNGNEIVPHPDSPAASKSLNEIALWLGLLVTRGDTGYCGPVREPTWIFIWNTEESPSWFGGYPVMVNARTGLSLMKLNLKFFERTGQPGAEPKAPN
jgi:hypothetical protein